MELLDTSISNVSLAAHRGRPRHQLRRKHLGTDQLPRCQRGHPADERVAQPRVRPQALLHDERGAIHRSTSLLCGVASEPCSADCVSRPARNWRWRSRAGGAGDPGGYLPQGEARRRVRPLQHGDRNGASGRSAARRMDHRQFLLALGFLYQRSDRVDLVAAVEPAGSGSRRSSPRNACKHGAAASCGSTMSVSR